MFKSYTICRVFITQQKISTPFSAKRYLCVIRAFLSSLWNWESFRFRVSACVWCVCVCVSVVFCICDAFQTSPLSEIPQQNNKIFATNSSQIWVFFEDLIKYIWSLKNCNTICKNRKKNYKKKRDVMVKDNSEAISSHAASSHGKCRFCI